MNPIDLHSHSTASDGLLDPAAVVRRAADRGVEVLALTDHDEVCGLLEARSAAEERGIRLIDGTEISVTWRDTTVHVVGLGIDPHEPGLLEGLQSIRAGRDDRAKRMGESLAQAGIVGAYEGALRLAASPRLISRTHFARFLVERGICRELKDVFRRYLTPGKPGYVRHAWATLQQAVGLIRGAGGTPVLAHPGRCRISQTAMRSLLGEFSDHGGSAIEVVTSNHTPAQAEAFAALARQFGLAASCGSDFHGPGESWVDLGGVPPLAPGLKPVWHSWA